MMKNRFIRRSIMLLVFYTAVSILWATMPLWLPLSLLIALLVPSARAMPRCLLFITGFLSVECLGMLAALWLWLRHGAFWLNPENPQYQESNYQLQFWWANSLKRIGTLLFALTFEVEGEDALDGDAAIVLPRHSSIGDTVLGLVFYGIPRDKRIRYVLKRELEMDPSLDIVGHRIPNYFVDRSSTKMSDELAALQDLATGLGPDDGVLIYIEGTRFTPGRRANVIESFKKRGDTEAVARAERMTEVLPPRMGGTLAIMDAAPEKDLVFCAHYGFEGSSHFRTLFSGAWVNSTIKIRFWRVPHTDIPADTEGKKALLMAQWEKMNDVVLEMKNG